MRVIVIDADGQASEAEGDVVVVMDEQQNVPIAMARRVADSVEFLTIYQVKELMQTLGQVLPAKLREQLLQKQPEVYEVDEKDRINRVS